MAEPVNNYDDADDPYRAIRVGDPGAGGEATKWGYLLTRFMRVMALFWLMQGLAQWRVVLTARAPIFDTMPSSAALAIIFFSVLDLIASRRPGAASFGCLSPARKFSSRRACRNFSRAAIGSLEWIWC